MTQLFHILTAVTLVFPIGLLDALPCWKEFASSNCMLEEVSWEDCEDACRMELEKQCVCIEHAPPLQIAGPVMRMPVFCAIPAVSRECIEMRGCRPPPVVEHC
ncbi:MAG: hypothetical protein KDB01_07690 [Planctomycetaceae bacterium]|nr:hypothetical protein [Planctomycetaceae bacterium]